MSDISAKAVFALRAKTGVSIIQCKKALEEANGDEAKAIDILRSKGEAQAVKKADRDQGEGYIFKAEEDGKAAMLTLHCETDFVARNDDFQSLGNEFAALALAKGADTMATETAPKITEAIQQLGENISLGQVEVVEGSTVGCYVHTNGKIGVAVALDSGSIESARDVAMHAAAMSPEYISPDEVPTEAVEKEKVIWMEQLKDEGKPAEIIEKIITGKEKKFREENALLKQAFVKDSEKTIEQFLNGAHITSYVRLSV